LKDSTASNPANSASARVTDEVPILDEAHILEARAVKQAALEARTLRRRAGLLAGGLLLFGFVSGYGVGFGVNRREAERAAVAKAPPPRALAPIVKAMRLSPNGRLLAFTAVYDGSRKSSRFVLDVKTGQFSGAESPGGWQDFVLGWDRRGNTLLLKRQRIPRPVAEADAGFYTQKLLAGAWPRFDANLRAVEPPLPSGQKGVSVTWDAQDRLVVKARREPEALFSGGRALDASSAPYLQSRAVRENGRTVLYVVRADGPDSSSPIALFRVDGGKARRLSADLGDMEWAYVAENGRWMIVARYAANNTDWEWTLYRVSQSRAQKVKTAVISGDVIGVYWSPDFKRVLGTNGKSLWLIGVPSLASRRIGDAKNSNADDATWSADSKSVFVAVDGRIWNVDIASNKVRETWRFPDQYWK
jgi:hypothetical protein